jgi:hypothetical protein
LDEIAEGGVDQGQDEPVEIIAAYLGTPIR